MPPDTEQIRVWLAKARGGWATLLRLTYAKDRLVGTTWRDIEAACPGGRLYAQGMMRYRAGIFAELDRECADASDLIAECEAKLDELGYRPSWYEPPPPPDAPTARGRKRQRALRAGQRVLPL